MRKGTVLFLLFVTVCIVGGVVLLPKLKDRMVGQQFRTRVDILSATLENIPLKGAENKKELMLVVALRLSCPLGEKPSTLDELSLLDWQKNSIDIDWEMERPWEDDFDHGTAQVELKSVYLPPNFRKGTLRRGPSELCAFEVPEPPYNAADESLKKSSAKSAPEKSRP